MIKSRETTVPNTDRSPVVQEPLVFLHLFLSALPVFLLSAIFSHGCMAKFRKKLCFSPAVFSQHSILEDTALSEFSVTSSFP